MLGQTISKDSKSVMFCYAYVGGAILTKYVE